MKAYTVEVTARPDGGYWVTVLPTSWEVSRMPAARSGDRRPRKAVALTLWGARRKQRRWVRQIDRQLSRYSDRARKAAA